MYKGTSTLKRGYQALDRPARSFFGALLGFVILDAVVLLFLLNPFAGLAPRTHVAYPLLDQAAIAAVASAPDTPADKPSPFPQATAAKGSAAKPMQAAPAFVEVNR